MMLNVSAAAADRAAERRRAVALARHFREAEGLSIAQIAERLGRSPATVKAYFYDPTGEKARAVKVRYQGVCRGCGAYTQPRNGKGDAYAYCNAPRGALSYPRRSREELEGMFWLQWLTRIRKVKGTIACQESGGHAQVSGVRRRGTRVIWRKLECLKPNLQKMERRIRRKDAWHRRHALRWHSCKAIATFGAWSVAQ